MVKQLADKPPKSPEALEKEVTHAAKTGTTTTSPILTVTNPFDLKEQRVQQQHKFYKNFNDSLILEIAQLYNNTYYSARDQFKQVQSIPTCLL